MPPLPIYPPGVTPPKPLPLTADDLLASARVTDFRFDLMERRYATDGSPLPEAIVGTLDTVQSGSIGWTYDASIKGSGEIVVIDVGQDVDWVTARIRPVAILGEGADATEMPLGIWIPAAPTEEYLSTHMERPVELLDKNTLLDQDVIADPITNAAISFSVAAGTNVMDTIRAIITGVGESALGIPVTGDVTVAPMTWDVGVTRLKIINDLLDSIGYFSLWVDNEGQYQATPYVDAADRPVVYEALAPFEGGRLVAPEWTRDHDIYSIPNRFVALSQGDGTNAGLAATATLDPSSPYSFDRRGRWVTQIEEGVEAADQTALENYAARRLAVSVATSARRYYTHPVLPDLRENNVVRLRDPDSDQFVLASVIKTEVVFDPLAFCETEVSEVVEVQVEEGS